MSKLVRNERLKLTANWLNTLATAIFAVGGFGPLVSYGFGLVPSSIDRLTVIAAAGTCLVVATTIHLAARGVLGSLSE
ncbi:hypothetical protein [Rhodopseudomonas palustris]|uniref:Amino acid transporter n=1 Tax=Rhodopseudomonas palustris (strain BisB18) TaxID=316056 RepID=Q218L1_RHOPB